MRAEILAYLHDMDITGFAVSDELPWDSQGLPLYLKNLKRIYVTDDDVVEETAIQVLNGINLQQETTTVRVFLATDAKNLSSNYTLVIGYIRAALHLQTITGFNLRKCSVNKTFENDVMINEIGFEFSKFL